MFSETRDTFYGILKIDAWFTPTGDDAYGDPDAIMVAADTWERESNDNLTVRRPLNPAGIEQLTWSTIERRDKAIRPFYTLDFSWVDDGDLEHWFSDYSVDSVVFGDDDENDLVEPVLTWLKRCHMADTSESFVIPRESHGMHIGLFVVEVTYTRTDSWDGTDYDTYVGIECELPKKAFQAYLRDTVSTAREQERKERTHE